MVKDALIADSGGRFSCLVTFVPHRWAAEVTVT